MKFSPTIWGGALLVLLMAGCTPDVLPLPSDMGSDTPTDPPLDPKSIFNAQAMPVLTANCQGCHALQQDIVAPFLVRGDEYNSITSYGMSKFLTPNPDQSLLLTKGPHMGPAIQAGQQYDSVHAWLEVEAATRSGLMMASPATPSVALRAGDFFISLEKLVGDPLAKLTFHVDARANGTYHISNIQITAGPLTGITITHPIFLIFSTAGVKPDPADSLSTVTTTIPTQMSASLGTVILTLVPNAARIAIAFQVIAQSNPMTGKMIQCKAFGLFNTTVRPTLQVPCAAVCHGAGAANALSASALGAFDMTSASSTDMTKLGLFCLQALARVNIQDPAHSVLALQPTPADQGGTSNHPFKLAAPTYSTFTQAIVSWAAQEK